MAQSASVAGRTRGSAAASCGVAPHLAAAIDERGHKRLQKPVRAGLVNEKRFGSAANTGASELGVQHDRAGFLKVGGFVHIDVADAFEMREHRNARLLLHALDEAFSAARHDHVDGAAKPFKEIADRVAICCRDELNGCLGQPRSLQPLDEAGVDCAIAFEAFGAAPQDHGIAGLEAEPARVGRDVGTAFVNDADDAQGHANAGNLEAIRPLPGRDDLAHRVGQSGDLVQPPRHGFDARFGERQAVDEGFRPPSLARCLAVGGIGVQDLRNMRPQAGSRRAQRLVLLACWRERQCFRRGFCLLPDAEQIRFQRPLSERGVGYGCGHDVSQ